MKHLIQNIFVLSILALTFSACDKVDDLAVNNNGTAPVLSASSTTIAPTPADSNSTALTLSWTDPNYAVGDKSTQKFIIQIDSAGKSFSNPTQKIVYGTLSTSYTAKELNQILVDRGYAFNVPVNMDVRLISSYSNNNDRFTSNTVTLKVTPYLIPPKVTLPINRRLFIVGDATVYGWTNTAPMPAVRELTRLDSTTWAGIYQLAGTGEYLLLPVAGDWTHKYSVANKTLPGLSNGGDFGYDLPDNFPGSVSGGAGWYKMTYDFQMGKFTAAKVDNAVDSTLWITGDATPGGWVNNPPASQKFTQVSNSVFEITMAFTGTGYYKFLSNSGNWQPQFGGSSATGGSFDANWGGGTDPAAVPAPAQAGNYKIRVNFITMTYTVTKL